MNIVDSAGEVPIYPTGLAPEDITIDYNSCAMSLHQGGIIKRMTLKVGLCKGGGGGGSGAGAKGHQGTRAYRLRT